MSDRTLALAALVDEWRASAEVARALDELAAELAAGDEPFVGRPLSEALVRGRLPAGIASAWVFSLRANRRNPAHHHPNSTQYTTAIRGRGTAHIAGEDRPMALFDIAQPIETIYEIPPHTPHAFTPGEGGLAVISFHTVLPEELIEVEVESSRRRSYVT
jgi:hypothetical protein